MIIPDFDFITTILNVPYDRIEGITTLNSKGTIYYYVFLKRKALNCPYCGNRAIGHGRKQRTIKHPTLIRYKSVVIYKANRYICTVCSKTFIEDNPFTFTGFNSSYSLLNNVLMKLGDLNYTLKIISKELHISPTMINNYLDSYITIPYRPYYVNNTRKRTIITMFGEISYKRTIYKDRLNGRIFCYVDEKLGIERYTRYTNDVAAYAAEAYCDENSMIKVVCIELGDLMMIICHKRPNHCSN